MTCLIECTGAFLLATAFAMSGIPWKQALWKGIFTAVSAFCNAGFALDSNNLESFCGNPLVILPVSFLIILGGLSPGLIWLLLTSYSKLKKQFSLQDKLILLGTSILLVFGTITIASFEWNGAFSHLSIQDKIVNAWFQSVTARTAGFSTIPLEQFSSLSLLTLMFLMFIGGSPGGTAGGVKTTTLMVLLIATLSVIKGDQRVQIFNRFLKFQDILGAVAAVVLSLCVLFTAATCLLLTQVGQPIDILFEVTSALGTVGLSTGMTPHINWVGKVVLMICMFLGRVGPLTVVFYFIHANRLDTPGAILAEEDVVTR